MKKWGSFILFFALIGSVSFGATASRSVNTTSELIVDQIVTNNNTTNVMKVDASIQTNIVENASTGYVWKYTVGGDTKCIQVTFDKEDLQPNTSQTKETLVGASVNRVLKIKGLKKGQATIQLTLARPWEKNIKPLETRLYTIEVK